MTDDVVPDLAGAAGPIEAKTKAGAWAAYAGAFVLFAILTSTATDLTFLPDWLETLVYPVIPALVALLGSYMKSHEPGKMSLSGVRAARRSRL